MKISVIRTDQIMVSALNFVFNYKDYFFMYSVPLLIDEKISKCYSVYVLMNIAISGAEHFAYFKAPKEEIRCKS